MCRDICQSFCSSFRNPCGQLQDLCDRKPPLPHFVRHPPGGGNKSAERKNRGYAQVFTKPTRAPLRGAGRPQGGLRGLAEVHLIFLTGNGGGFLLQKFRETEIFALKYDVRCVFNVVQSMCMVGECTRTEMVVVSPAVFHLIPSRCRTAERRSDVCGKRKNP